LNGVFVDAAARMRIDRAWRAFVGGEASDFGHATHDGKRRVMQTSLIAELSVLANRLRRIARANRSTRDLTLSTLWQALMEVTAKGVEDTSFYTFTRLVSLNEVGGDPDQFGTSVKAFHRANAERLAHWPDTMLAGSTHDNKRSEDVRARIDVISEMPAAWRLR